ncbi:MAG TPA: hypothetical protein VEK38_02170 [Candidatus Bathyarchaeia archaeon]|nr:hypothetical protein [Candidatus Bathyarchaeia archaeon]
MDEKIEKSSLYCSYYQATVDRPLSWFVVAALKSYEHMSFDRTIDVASSTFEFFVPESTEQYFLQLMDYFSAQGLVKNVQKLPNRCAEE